MKELLADVGCKDEITAVSGFRTQREQREIWDDSMAKNGEMLYKTEIRHPLPKFLKDPAAGEIRADEINLFCVLRQIYRIPALMLAVPRNRDEFSGKYFPVFWSLYFQGRRKLG